VYSRSSTPLISAHIPHLARPQHRRQSTLLRTRNRQRIHALNLNPHPRVRAVITRKRRLPRLRSLISLALIHIVRDGKKLRVRQVVGESLAARGGPRCGAGLVR
jgi:hypothetical protein